MVAETRRAARQQSENPESAQVAATKDTANNATGDAAAAATESRDAADPAQASTDPAASVITAEDTTGTVAAPAASDGAANPVVPPPLSPLFSPAASAISIGTFDDVPDPNQTVIDTIRQSQATRTVLPAGWGFANNTCYRNAVVIMLLCTDRFMSYVENHHMEQIKLIKGDEAKNHEDVLVRLHTLAQEYWSPNRQRKRLTTAINTFWTYCTGSRSPLGSGRWAMVRGTQQDVTQFLGWMLNSAVTSVGNDMSLIDLVSDFQDVVQLRLTNRMTCAGCRRGNNVRHRISTVDSSYMWPLSLQINETDAVTSEDLGVRKSELEIDEVMANSCRSTLEGRLCAQCQTARDNMNPEDKEAFNAKCEAEGDQILWQHLRRLPEVLFMHLLRFSPKVDENGNVAFEKDEVPVVLKEEIDVAPYLEKTIPAQKSTKYRLTNVISHSGSLKGGHYINYTKINGKWYEINGTSVVEVQFDNIAKQEKPVKPVKGKKPQSIFTPYLLTWEKVIPVPTPKKKGGLKRKVSDDSDEDGGAPKKLRRSPRRSASAEAEGDATKASGNEGGSKKRKAADSGDGEDEDDDEPLAPRRKIRRKAAEKGSKFTGMIARNEAEKDATGAATSGATQDRKTGGTKAATKPATKGKKVIIKKIAVKAPADKPAFKGALKKIAETRAKNQAEGKRAADDDDKTTDDKPADDTAGATTSAGTGTKPKRTTKGTKDTAAAADDGTTTTRMGYTRLPEGSGILHMSLTINGQTINFAPTTIKPFHATDESNGLKPHRISLKGTITDNLTGRRYDIARSFARGWYNGGNFNGDKSVKLLEEDDGRRVMTKEQEEEIGKRVEAQHAERWGKIVKSRKHLTPSEQAAEDAKEAKEKAEKVKEKAKEKEEAKKAVKAVVKKGGKGGKDKDDGKPRGQK